MALQDAIGFVEAQLARFAEVVGGFGGVAGIEATKAPVVVGFGKTGILTDGLGEIVDGRRKADLLRLIAMTEKVNIAQTIAVGDGANDLPMLLEAGLGIAFHAKPRVKEEARQSLSTIGLDGVLYFLGFKDSHLGEQGRL